MGQNTKVNFYLNNTTKIEYEPLNSKALELELNFESDSVNEQVTVTDFEFVNEGNDEIKKHIEGGLTGSVGVFEGLPFRVEIERNGQVENPFNGYLDLLNSQKLSRDRSTVRAIETNRIDWLNDVAEGFTFEYLFKEIGSITTDDFIKIPYILNSVPNYTDAAIGVLSVYMMVKEIKDAIQKLIEFTADLPVYYVFSTYVKLILYIIFLIIMIIALIKLVKSVILLLIQPVKYHASMNLKTMLTKGCEYLNLKLRAPDFDAFPFSDAYYMPPKYFNPVNKKEKQILGFTEPSIEQEGFMKGTFGDALRLGKQIINGKIFIKGDELWLVRRDFNVSEAQYILPPIPYRKEDFYTLNTDEFKSNRLITFETDLSDKNTIQNYLGTSYQVITQPQRVNDQKHVLMKGLDEMRLPCARAIRKEALTVPEQILDGFLKIFSTVVGALVTVVNAIITVLNVIIAIVNDILKKLAAIGIKLKFNLPPIPKIKMPDIKNIFSNRIGMLMIEADNFNMAKLFILQLGGSPKTHKIHPDNSTIISAKYLWENFYFIESFIPTDSKPNANQFIRKEIAKITLTFQDYLKIKENNLIFTSDGFKGLIYSLRWIPLLQTASIIFGINKLYTNNLREIYYEPDGR